MAYPVKRFNWTRSATGWQQFQAWQERRRAMREDFDAVNAAARNSFTAAWSGQISGATELAAQAAQDRVLSAIKTKIDTLV